jgi:hypothetical protein
MNEIVNGVVCCVVQYVNVELDMTGSISCVVNSICLLCPDAV